MEPEVYASRYGRVLTVTLAVVGVIVVVGLAAAHDPRGLALAVTGSGLAVGGAWALFWRPRVEVSDGGVTIVNVVRTVHVPWPVLVEAEPGWSLVVRTTRRSWTAWAAPRASGTSAGLRRVGGRRGRDLFARLRRDDEAPHVRAATSEAVAAAITGRQDALVAAGHLDGARLVAEKHGLAETVTWHRGTIAAALALATALVLAATF